MNYLGAGARMLRSMMKDASVDSVEQLLAAARWCEATLDTVLVPPLGA